MQDRTWADKVRDFFFPSRDTKTELAKESQIDPVPLHRSYGVRKREGFFAHLNNALAPALAIVMILVFAITWVLGFVILIFVLGNIGIMIAITAVILFIYFKLCRKIRKRIKFIFKLNKK